MMGENKKIVETTNQFFEEQKKKETYFSCRKKDVAM